MSFYLGKLLDFDPNENSNTGEIDETGITLSCLPEVYLKLEPAKLKGTSPERPLQTDLAYEVAGITISHRTAVNQYLLTSKDKIPLNVKRNLDMNNYVSREEPFSSVSEFVICTLNKAYYALEDVKPEHYAEALLGIFSSSSQYIHPDWFNHSHSFADAVLVSRLIDMIDDLGLLTPADIGAAKHYFTVRQLLMMTIEIIEKRNNELFTKQKTD